MSDATNWSPFRRRLNGGAMRGDHNHFPTSIDQVFDEFARGFAVPTGWTPGTRAWVWTNRDPQGSEEAEATVAPYAPALDFWEMEDAYRLDVELPGVDPESVDLTVDDERIMIVASRPTPDEGPSPLHRERTFGEFERAVALPGPVEIEAVTATFRNGLLTVHLPKRAETSTGRKIEITS